MSNKDVCFRLNLLNPQHFAWQQNLIQHKLLTSRFSLKTLKFLFVINLDIGLPIGWQLWSGVLRSDLPKKPFGECSVCPLKTLTLLKLPYSNNLWIKLVDSVNTARLTSSQTQMSRHNINVVYISHQFE